MEGQPQSSYREANHNHLPNSHNRSEDDDAVTSLLGHADGGEIISMEIMLDTALRHAREGGEVR